MILDIDGNKVFLVWNRGHKNMWDEIILVWNMKLLLKAWKTMVVACSNKDWLINFHKQFFLWWNLDTNEDGFYDKDTKKQIITYLPELPKWFRSWFRFLKNIKNIKKYLETDSILIWWWEIFTEETPGSYWYWLASVWFLLFWRKLYLSGGIQFPKKIWNKIPFYILTKKAEKLFVRDFDLIENKNKLSNKIAFFPDTSIFVYDNIDLKKYKWNIEKKEKKNYIIVNVNKKAEQFLPQIKEKIKEFYDKWYEVYFAEICKSPKDMDLIYFDILKNHFPNIKLLDWENWDDFINVLLEAEKVFTTRLHLFLISFYLNLDVNPFVYQKKVEKMKKVLFNIDK